jgi:hypothetical protein
VQEVKLASQCPAQATPFDERLRIEVSLEEKVMVVLRFVPEAVWTAAVKPRVPPRLREVVLEGLRAIFPGKRGGPALEPPPHAALNQREKIAMINQGPLERNLPMHSSFFIIKLDIWSGALRSCLRDARGHA